jgi:hypothetical protein
MSFCYESISFLLSMVIVGFYDSVNCQNWYGAEHDRAWWPERECPRAAVEKQTYAFAQRVTMATAC